MAVNPTEANENGSYKNLHFQIKKRFTGKLFPYTLHSKAEGTEIVKILKLRLNLWQDSYSKSRFKQKHFHENYEERI